MKKPSPEGICCGIGLDIMDNLPDKYVLRNLLQITEPHLSSTINRLLAKEFSIADSTHCNRPIKDKANMKTYKLPNSAQYSPPA